MHLSFSPCFHRSTLPGVRRGARSASPQALAVSWEGPFSYPEPFLRAVNGARQGALAKSISNWHLIGYNEGYCSNNVYILLPCFYGIRFWIWPEPLVAPRVRRALGTRMGKVTMSRGPAESCKMNKCCFEPASLKKAVLFVQRWCGQQILSLINASFHVLRVAILIYKFHAVFL